MSTSTSGFVRGCTASACRIGYGQRVAEMTRSASVSSTATASNGGRAAADAPASSCALSSVRLETTTSAPRAWRSRAASSLILPGAEQQGALALEAAERFGRELDSGRRDRLGHLRELRLGAHALARVERILEEPVQHRPGRAGGQRGLVGLAHLAEDLRLARHERVEAGRHAEEVLDRLARPPSSRARSPSSRPERRSSSSCARPGSPPSK